MWRGLVKAGLVTSVVVLFGYGAMDIQTASAQEQKPIGSALIDLLTKRSAERAGELCRAEVEESGHRVRGILDTTPNNSGFLVGVRIRRDGKNRRIECQYDLASDQASLLNGANQQSASKSYRQKSKDLPIVRAIKQCFDQAKEAGLEIDGVSQAAIKDNGTEIVFGIDSSADQAYACTVDNRRGSAQLLAQSSNRWVTLDRQNATDARSKRAEQACIAALKKSGASYRATRSIERKGKRMIVSMRAKKDGNGFNASCRFNLNTGYTAISTP